MRVDLYGVDEKHDELEVDELLFINDETYGDWKKLTELDGRKVLFVNAEKALAIAVDDRDY